MRMIWQGLGLSSLLAASLAISNGTLRAADQPVVHVKTVVRNGSVRLEAQANAPFEYTSYRPSESLFVVDLSGVSAGDPAGARVVPSELVKSYRVVPFTEGDKPMVRVEVLIAQGLAPHVEKTDAQDLVLSVERTPGTSMPAPSLPSIVPTSETVVSRGHDSVGYIRNVTIQEDGDKAEVAILTSSPLAYHPMHLANPDRLVLDFPSSHLAAPLRQVASNLDPIRAVRIAQYTPETARVVIDLRQPAGYDIHTNGNTVTVSFAAKSLRSNTAPRSGDASAGTATTQKIGAVPAPAVSLPVQLTHPAAALAAQDGGQIQMGGVMGAMSAAQSSGGASAPSGVPSGNPAVVPAASSSMATVNGQAAATPAASVHYSGDPISVNLKDVDLADFFRLIHEISGLNVVVDPAVKGTLTIVLDNVPWDQALDIVLKNNGLDKQLDGNVLRIATRATLKSEAQEISDLARAQAEAADVVTTTRVLSYAKATAVALTLKKFLSSRGDILSDDRTNSLIIRDIPSTFPVIDNLLRQLDRRAQQVEIEARVVSANRSFARELGVILGGSGAALSGHNANVVGGDSNVGATQLIFGGCPPIALGTCTPPTPTSPGKGTPTTLFTNLGANAPTSGLQYAFQSANVALDAVIDAAESKGVGKLLSEPKILTQNNEKGTAKDGVKIPIQTVVNNTVSVQFVDAALELDVTPQITADGTIYMDVTVENDQIDNGIPRVQGIPAIDTQSAETKVTVNDGATVVIGGMIITNQQTQVNDVPLVGSLPVIGNLFKHTTVSSTSQELLFFLTPRILPS